MITDEPESPLGKIPIEKLRSAAVQGRRSPLFQYMEEHFSEVSEALAGVGKPNWSELSRVFAEAGLTDISGQPPAPETCRHTWLRVRVQMAKLGRAPTPGARRKGKGRGRKSGQDPAPTE